MVYLGRGRGVDILPGSKRLDHVRVLRDMRKHTQFDLRVIRVDQHMLRVGRDEHTPQLTPQFSAHRNVL